MNKQLIVAEEGKVYKQPDGQYVITVSPDAGGYISDKEDDDEIDLRELLAVIRRRKGTILAITAIAFLVALIFTLSIQPVYKATAKIQIDSEESAQVLSFDVGISGDSSKNEFLQTQFELLKSNSLARATMNDLRERGVLLGESTRKDSSDDSSWTSGILTSLAGFIRGEDKFREKAGKRLPEETFLANLTVAPVKKSQIAAISYESVDPEFAAEVANAIAGNFIQMTLKRRIDGAAHAQQFLDDEVKKTGQELEALEKQVNDYAKNEEIIQASGENSDSLIAKKTIELSTTLTQAEALRIETEANYQEALKTNGLAEIMSSPVTQALKQRIIDAEGDYTQKLQKYKPRYPVMVELKQKINEFKSQLRKEEQAISTSVKSKLKSLLDAAIRKEARISALLEDNKRQLQGQRDKSVEYSKLRREAETKRELHKQLLLRVNEVRVAARIGTNNVAIVDKAELPYAPQKPNIQLNLALGAILGLFLGTVISFLLEFLDDRIKSADELQHLLDLPLLGMIPMVKGHDPVKHSMATASAPTSAIAESFRSLRTNLLFATQDGTPKVLALTSSMPSEGKSSSCINLATTFAQSGTKVLLIDADLRKPTVHKRLKLDNANGLSSFLTGKIDSADAIQETLIDNVFAIPAGPQPPNPAELLSSERFKELSALAPDHFDLIIIDCPPVMGLADALILSKHATATILVSAFSQTRKRPLLDAYRRLKQAKVNIIGTVLGKVKSGGGYSYQYEYEYYSYGNDSEQLEDKAA